MGETDLEVTGFLDQPTCQRYRSPAVTSPEQPLPSWVANARDLPLAFAQVREDPRIDAALVQVLHADGVTEVDLLQIASGGCTAAVLAALPGVRLVHLVDPNPAQLALTRLKLASAQTLSSDERLRLFGHLPMEASKRADHLQRGLAALQMDTDALGPLAQIAELGPDQAGRYEQLFVALRHALQDAAPALQELLTCSDPAQQARIVAAGSALGIHLAGAFDETMALENLVELFGQAATGNAVQAFAAHFTQRLLAVVRTLPAANNPYLWQLLAGRYPPHHPADWFLQPAGGHQARITWVQATMDQALAVEERRFHLIHLSNILDWLDPAQARATLTLARAHLHPGGLVVIRQLNSSLDIPALAPDLNWDGTRAQQLLAGDRSFFYRGLHIGRRSA